MPVIRIDEETKAALEQHRLRLASDAQSGVGNSMNSTLRHLLEKKVAPLDETDQPTVRRQDDGGISISYPSELTSAEYESPVLGLVFLRFLDHKFASVQAQLEGQKSASSRRTIGKADYIAQGAIFLTEESRYAHLLQLPEGSDLGQAVSDAMEIIENENPGLKGILPRDYSRVTNSILATLLRTFSEISIDIEGDVFGRIYEYFLGKFAMAAGQSGGESYTPTSLTKLIVEIIEPYSGRVLDPASGSAGMLVQSAEFVKRHERNLAELSIFGQENVAETVRLGKMNLAVNDLSGDIFHGNTYYEDVHDSVGKFDFVMANPPFNVTGIDKEQISDDPRFPFGMPGPDNGNYIWMQIFWSALNDGGRAGFVMANSASDVRQSEQEIRKQIIDAGDVDVMVAIGSNFFTHVTLPCTLWFFDKGKRETDRKDKVLFIDARNIFEQVDRAHREFRPDQIEFLANIVRLYRGQEIEDLMGSDDLMIENFPELTYQDVAGLCKVATVDEIRTQGYSLNPGRYVGVADKSSITGTAVGRPNSSDEVIQNLLDGLFSGALDRGIDLQLSRDRSGRWITYPDNFMSIMLQPRNRCLLITVYGKPEAFNELGHSLQLKIDRPPYSRFHVRTESQLASALDIIESSRNLRADMIFGAALKFEPMQQFDVKPLEQTCSLLAVPTGLGKTSLIGQQIRSLSAERCLIITSSKAIAETMQAQLYARFALPFEVLDRTRTIEGTNVLPKRSGQFLFITTHHVFKQWLSTGECERLLPTREGPLWDLVAIEEIQPLVSSESLDFDEFTYGESWWERETTLRSPTFTNHLVVLTTPQVLQRTEELDSISNLFDQRWSYSGGSRLMSESTAQEVWRAVLGDLQLQFPRPTFETWLKPTEGVAYDDHVFEVEAPNSFAVEWLERRMYHALQKTLHEVSGREFELRLTVKPQGDFYAVEQSFPVPDQAVSATPAAPPLLEMRSFNPKYSFDTFVAGPSNRLALSASRDVAESPGQTYNPLFLHSGAGLGKTHLLQAIGKSCASRGMSVLYVTSEQFTNEFITAIRNRTTEDFRRRYRSVQVLLMDDVQFLSGNEQTHEGFFHTFNDLQNSGNQVVISSDRPPRELGSIEDRLRSRFEGGLIADIQPPDLETRMAILANKAGQMRIDLEDSVIELIAKRVQRNVRELEGSLNRMVAYSQLMNVNINLESTSRILDELTADTDRHSVDPERIIEEPLENRE